jgi:hypothetical protein
VQLPVVVLSLNLDGTSSSSSSSGGVVGFHFSPAELETLFHEWGHAMHSLLSRTQFQHTSGTRGALDFVEIPSHLFEYWARDYDSVAAFAVLKGHPHPQQHPQGHPQQHPQRHLPKELWDRVQASRAHWRGTELLQVCVHSLFDLALFGGQAIEAAVMAGPEVSVEEARALAGLTAAALAGEDEACKSSGGGGGGGGGCGGAPASCAIGASSASAARLGLTALRAQFARGGSGTPLSIDLCPTASGGMESQRQHQGEEGKEEGEEGEEEGEEEVGEQEEGAAAPARAPPPHPLTPSGTLLQAVGRRYSVLPPLDKSHWHGGFAHLGHYGGGYYTYALAAVASAALWRALFAGRVFSRASGEVLRRELLEKGGAGDPRAMLAACLRRQEGGSGGGRGGTATGRPVLPLEPLLEEVWGGALAHRIAGRVQQGSPE